MTTRVQPDWNRMLTAALGETVTAGRVQSVGGGCIAETFRVELRGIGSVFVKRMAADPGSCVLGCEENGLQTLSDAEQVRIPRILGSTVCEGAAILVLEHIEPMMATDGLWGNFGHRLAQLHGCHRVQARDRSPGSQRYGFFEDNYIGLSAQENGFSEDWSEFFASRRIGYQLKLLSRQDSTNLGDSLGQLRRGCEKLVMRLDRFLPSRPQASLLHGDLWSGNFMFARIATGANTTGANTVGEPVIFDPAVYYGDREAELAMPRLFGGFPDSFFQAYEEEWPLEDGWQTRVEIYKLYHLLNHVNLFGSSYLPSCFSVLRQFV